MLNLLVITPHPDARQKASGLIPEGACRVTIRPDAMSAATLVERGVFDAVLMLSPTASEHTLDEIRAIRRSGRDAPLALVVSGSTPLPWEESALASGADVILREPVSISHILGAFKRIAPAVANGAGAPPPGPQPTLPTVHRGSLEILRDFSHILGYSLDHKLFAEQFVQKVREIVGVSRIAVYLEKPPTAVSGIEKSPRLSCVAAVGVPPDVIECFELSRNAGIGARMCQAPQILSASHDSFHGLSPADQKIQREFEILGCRVAVPISDRTRTIGVAVLGGHVTGRSFNADELQLLFLLMEELGSAIKNTWLHRQLSSSHRLLADVLATLSSGCLVVDQELNVLHANRAVVAFLKGASARESHFEFADLPPNLAGPLYDTVAKGAKTQPFFFTGGHGGENLFRISIIPFHAASATMPQSAMLVMEDFTQIESAKRFEIEASKAKLISLIAKRFAHEIRNSLVPLATHEQLLESEYQNDDFRRSLKTALSRETTRIQRFTEQMLFLAQPPRTANETASLRDLVESCFHNVCGAVAPAGRLDLACESDLPLVRCHRAALEHALQEIVTNALQANTVEAVVTARIAPASKGMLQLTVHDSGPGFTAEAAASAMEPFFTTRNTGVGLGLTVARKIIEDHHGKLFIHVRANPADHDVEIQLPAVETL